MGLTNKLKKLRKRITSNREETLLAAACLQTQTATFPWVSNLPTYTADFTLANFWNYISQFFETEMRWQMWLYFFSSFLAAPWNMKVPRPKIIWEPHLPPTPQLWQPHPLTHCRNATILVWQQELQESLFLIHTHINTNYTRTIFFLLLWRILTNTPAMT